jgi:hypothetical protein
MNRHTRRDTGKAVDLADVVTGIDFTDPTQVRAAMVKARPIHPPVVITDHPNYADNDQTNTEPSLTWSERWEIARPWAIRIGQGMVALAGVSAVATVVWLVYLAVMAVIAWFTAHLAQIVMAIVTVIIGLILIAAMSSSSGHRCSGMHCGGCRR